MPCKGWDDWDASKIDDETTELTEFAKRFAKRSAICAAAAEEINRDYLYAEGGAALRVLANGYVTEFRGQSSATGHGKQGSDPRRIAALRRLPCPVRLVFIDARNEIDLEQKWQEVWLGREHGEPDVVEIDKATTHRRQGWRVSELRRGAGLVDFPETAPVVVPAQGGLL